MLNIHFRGEKKVIKQPTVDVNQDPGLHKKPIVSPTKKAPGLGKHKLNWVRQKPDSRDIPYKLSPLVTLPESVDLRQWCSPVDDQGQLGSCTGNSIAGAIDLVDRKYNSKQTQVSRLFIYYYERVMEGDVGTDGGAQIRDGIKVTYTYGAPLETLWPYNISKFTVAPSSAAVADAATRKVTLYEAAADFNAVQNALASGYPVVIGFDVYSSFESQQVATTGMMPYPNVNQEQLLGGHAVCIVGYDNTKNYFIVRNSWGTSWGDNGYFYMPYQVIQNTNMSSDFWVIKSVNDPS